MEHLPLELAAIVERYRSGYFIVHRSSSPSPFKAWSSRVDNLLFATEWMNGGTVITMRNTLRKSDSRMRINIGRNVIVFATRALSDISSTHAGFGICYTVGEVFYVKVCQVPNLTVLTDWKDIAFVSQHTDTTGRDGNVPVSAFGINFIVKKMGTFPAAIVCPWRYSTKIVSEAIVVNDIVRVNIYLSNNGFHLFYMDGNEPIEHLRIPLLRKPSHWHIMDACHRFFTLSTTDGDFRIEHT
jgi:hypothetical protein